MEVGDVDRNIILFKIPHGGGYICESLNGI
jgi:hypothetical protein